MKITNKFNLPEPILKVLHRTKYKRGFCDFTVSELIAPQQKKRLFDKYDDKIEVDASEMLYALDGTALHDLLEKADRGYGIIDRLRYFFSNIIVEKRIYYWIDGYKIGGKPDRLVVNKKGKSVTIQDYKKVKVWEYIYGFKKEKEIQLNLYAYYWMLQGYHIEDLEIVAFFKDYSKSQAKYKPDYPKAPIITIKVKVWKRKEIEDYIKKRLKVHTAKNIVLCSAEERWNEGDRWAVKKKGNKRAIRVFNNKKSAEQFCREGQVIEFRKGESKRCKDWCIVKDFCEQYKNERSNV